MAQGRQIRTVLYGDAYATIAMTANMTCERMEHEAVQMLGGGRATHR